MGAVAAAGYALVLLTAVVLQAVVVRFRVVTPSALAADVAADRTLWMLAQAVLIGQQELLALVAVALPAVVGRLRAGAVFAMVQFGAAALMFVLSGVVHGVFGTHLGGLHAVDAAAREGALRDARILHALGDTTYFAGLALLAIAMLALYPAVRDSPVLPRGLARLGLAAAAAEIAEFGWFVLPGLGYLAPIGVVLQAAWFAWLGRRLWDAPSPATVREPTPMR
jgi:hypothetical protein